MTPRTPATPPERTLSDVDLDLIRAITREAASDHTCLNLNPKVADALNRMTPEQIGMLDLGMWLIGKASMIVGGVILTAIASALVLLFTRGFWSSIATGLKSGGNLNP